MAKSSSCLDKRALRRLSDAKKTSIGSNEEDFIEMDE